MLNQKLIVLNMNQQSDSSDLMGGFKPVQLKILFNSLKIKFEELFCKTYKKEENAQFLGSLNQVFI